MTSEELLQSLNLSPKHSIGCIDAALAKCVNDSLLRATQHIKANIDNDQRLRNLKAQKAAGKSPNSLKPKLKLKFPEELRDLNIKEHLRAASDLLEHKTAEAARDLLIEGLEDFQKQLAADIKFEKSNLEKQLAREIQSYSANLGKINQTPKVTIKEVEVRVKSYEATLNELVTRLTTKRNAELKEIADKKQAREAKKASQAAGWLPICNYFHEALFF